jgi:hypothetical protein
VRITERVPRRPQDREQFVGDRNQPPRSTLVIQAAVDHQPVDPGTEEGIPAEIGDRGKQLQEGVLCDIHRQRLVPAEAQGDGIDLVLVRFEQNLKGLAFAAPASFHEFTVRPVQNHRRL